MELCKGRYPQSRFSEFGNHFHRPPARRSFFEGEGMKCPNCQSELSVNLTVACPVDQSEAPSVEFPNGFPRDESQAVQWASVGCKATSEQVSKYWFEAAARGGKDWSGQPISRWVLHCNARAIREQNNVAEKKSLTPAFTPRPMTVHEINTKLTAVNEEIDKIKRMARDEYYPGSSLPTGKKIYTDAQKATMAELKKRRDELRTMLLQ
jgi:hypothetical protein